MKLISKKLCKKIKLLVTEYNYKFCIMKIFVLNMHNERNFINSCQNSSARTNKLSQCVRIRTCHILTQCLLKFKTNSPIVCSLELLFCSLTFITAILYS